MYDAIVVGARCAGSPTAMLLARKGHRVLLVDRATFPSDTVSTHVVQAPAVAALRDWGLLDAVVASGCPPIERYVFDFGPIAITGTPRPADGNSTGYAPRRTVLDKILVDAAVAAGAELRERYNVRELVYDDGRVVGIRGHDRDGGSTVDRARVVIAADGRNSEIARAVQAETYNEKPKLEGSHYTYFADLPVDGFEIYTQPYRGFAAVGTNDGLTLVIAGRPIAEAADYKADPEAGFMATVDLVPSFGERVRSATRVERFTWGATTNFYRKPYGPGWALVGDAGYNKDPITAQGITDAFRDARLCATALDQVWSTGRPFDEAMAEYQRTRDAQTLPFYEFNAEIATLEPPPPEMQELFGAIAGNQDAMDDFVSLNAATVSPADFFAPDHVATLMAAAH